MEEQLERLRSAVEERHEVDNFNERLVTWAGAYTILFIGLAHILISGEHFLAAPYLGVLFLANGAGSILTAFGIAYGAHRWAWLLGDLIAGGAFVCFVVSRAVGLPGYTEVVGEWFNIGGLLTLALDVLFVTLSLLALTSRGRTLTRRVEQERAELEQAIVEEALDDIEKEMSDIRSHMSPDLSDLRMHVEPQAVKEQVKQGLRERTLGPVMNILKRRRGA